MEGDVAAAVAFEKFDATFLQERQGGHYVCSFGVAAQRDHWLVFEQEENVADFFFFAECDQLLLQA